MSKRNNKLSEEIVRLWWELIAYDRIVSDCLLSLPDGEDLRPAIETIGASIEDRLKRIIKALK